MWQGNRFTEDEKCAAGYTGKNDKRKKVFSQYRKPETGLPICSMKTGMMLVHVTDESMNKTVQQCETLFA